MGFRFQKRIKIGKGFGLNISKSSITPSFRNKRGSLSSKGYSLRTGIPGLSYRKTFKKTKGSGCLLVFLLLIFFATIISCKSERTESNNYQEDSNETEVNNSFEETKKWYQGGDLHEAEITDWKSASSKNKLATCGDFCAKIYSENSLNEIKELATNLMICIDEAVKGHDAADNFTVSEVASMCLIMLEN